MRTAFVSIYGREPRLFSAPGRVNLIGEHTDYNDGFVLPMAIDRRTVVAAAVRDDRTVRVQSQAAGESGTFDLDQPTGPRKKNWLDYVEGVAYTLEARGARLRGADLLVASDVPIGAGLSSSAALEISVALALTALAGHDGFSRIEMAKAAQAAEQEYAGILCGIMDQFIATLGRADHALLIDCRSLESKEVPIALDDKALLVCNTGVAHALASSEYNLRRAECFRGVELIRATHPEVRALRDVSVPLFEKLAATLPQPVRNRCRHVVTENARTLAAARALAEREFGEFGGLMVASHSSLRTDYEVSSPELDLCVDVAMSIEGVFGARMTGGGFGGCTVTLVDRHALASLSAALTREFARAFGRRPELFATRAAEGAKEHR